MRPVGLWMFLCVLAFVGAGPDEANAQFVGSFRWQFLPYCNVVTLNVTQQGGVFTLDGFDDQCGAANRASVVGTAFSNPDGSIGIGLNMVTAPGGSGVHVDARISLLTLGGTWQDSTGHGGAFVFAPGGSTGGSPRPVSQKVTRVFPGDQITWELETLNTIVYRKAVLSVPEITPGIVDSGAVHVSFAAMGFSEPWTVVPFTGFIASGGASLALILSVAPGQVVVRFSISTNADPGAPVLPFKVVVVP